MCRLLVVDDEEGRASTPLEEARKVGADLFQPESLGVDLWYFLLLG